MRDLRIEFSTLQYIGLLLLHVGIGGLIFLFPAFSKIYCIAIFVLGLLYVIKKQNRGHEVLLVSAYITGAEVLMRATDGVPLYEFAKYAVMIMALVGMIYSGFSRNAVPYWFYLLLLVPGVVVSVFVLNASIEDRKLISFVISGPAQLGVMALYTYQRKVSFDMLNRILLCVGMPIVSHTVYLIFYTPNIRDVLTGTDSNAEASGGFGPNQVSTVIGLGIFIFISRVILRSANKLESIVNLVIAMVMAYRGIVTFSRGGVYAAIVTIALLILGAYIRFNYKAKRKLHLVIVLVLGMGTLIWSYSLLQTDGLIGKRYANQDAAGREKESRFTGREELVRTEVNAFYDSPLLGVGVGKSIEMRERATGISSASHNEITRLLAEHGSLGILALLILFATPLLLHLDNRENFFMLPLLFFWLLTINHAAMRIAAPGFIYSLSLLKLFFPDAPRRKKRQFKGMVAEVP